jgi:transposase
MNTKKGTPSGGDGRNWPAYNEAQLNEKSLFLRILWEICREIEAQEQEENRKALRLRDRVFCSVFKVYSSESARRFVEDLQEVREKGLIKAVPSPTSLAEHMRAPLMPDLLQRLLVKSSLPLSEAEDVFAADSTGFSLPQKHIWFNKHTMRRQKRRGYMKLHVMVGVKANIITYAKATVGTASDMAHLRQLIEGTARYFDISEVSADAGYLSGQNMHTVLLHGGIPYFAFKKNCALDADYKSTIWKDLLYLWKTRHPVYTEHYFRRNNVEATFHSIKAKFGSRLYSKSTNGQFSEALAKALCHNICTLIRATYELGIDPLAWSDKLPRPRAEGITITEAMRHRKEELLEIRTAAGSRELPPQEKPPRRSRRARPRKGKDSVPGQIQLFE